MFTQLLAGSVAVSALTVGVATGAEARQTADVPTHTLQVSGTGVAQYPAYDPSVRRYAATTTEDTFPSDAADNTSNHGASVTVRATTSDPTGQVLVDGVPVTGDQTTLTGLDAGDEISVIYVDSSGREADSVFLLPADFPTLTATVQEPGVTPGLVGLTLSQWAGNGWPQFDTTVDAHGVPTWVHTSHQGGIDLKRQPNGHVTEARPTTTAGRTGADIVEMDSSFDPVASHRTVGLTNTDSHDSILEPDGSMVLLAYEPNTQTGKTDSVIQEVDADGNVVFQWDSSALADESVVAGADYAHINSVQIVDDGDDFLASFRNLSTVIEIARLPHDGYQPGDIVWKLGGRDSSFTFQDDAYDGPCGQHTASLLPDGDVMVFDDGSSDFFGALCVDQSDPAGPVHERPQSRVAIYHLDQTDGTATLVRSYAPHSWFAWFMGSTQYLPQTGNILVGWASATQAVATELAPDNTPVWELVATQSTNARTYFSYRSLKFAAPDTVDPVVDVTTPAENAHYDQGAVVTSGYSCTDTGGSTLQACGDTPPGAPLSTSPGPHTFTVIATDGADNTTTVTRHYSVAPLVTAPVRRPDVVVQRGDGTWLGSRVYGGPAHQTDRRRLSPDTRVRVAFRLANHGNADDRCLVRGSSGSTRVAASYWSGGRDVTAKVVAGTWRTPTTSPGSRQVLQLRLTVARHAVSGSTRTFTVTCASTHARTTTDAAGVRVTVR
jgi:hypothetical protein